MVVVEKKREEIRSGDVMVAPLVLVVPDGAADYACSSLQFRTPLEKARRRKALDALATDGLAGLLCPLGEGVACGSDTAHIELLGGDSPGVYTGRGPLEARGCGHLPPGAVAFKCVLAHVDERSNTVTSRRAGGVCAHDARCLLASLDKMRLPEGSSVRVLHDHSHRAVVTISHSEKHLGDDIEGTDPREDGLELLSPSSRGTGTSSDVNALTAREVDAACALMRERLREHHVNAQREDRGELPANVLLLRGAGRLPDESVLGSESTVVTHTKVIGGVGRALGCADVHMHDVEDMRAMANDAVEAVTVQGKEFVLLHFKATDDAGHAGDPETKAELLADVDATVEKLLKELPEEATMCVAPDHATPCRLQDHTAEPVPVACAQVGAVCIESDGEEHRRGKTSFTECGARHGGLGLLCRGRELITTVRQEFR